MHLRFVYLATLLTITLNTPAFAVITINFNFGSVVITDQGTGDTNGSLNILGFNQVIGNYSVAGEIDLVAGANQVTLLGSPVANLRMTNFTAEALVASPGILSMEFYEVFNGTYTGVVGADSLDAYVGHSSGSAVPAGQDTIWQWQGYVSGQIITLPSPGLPPYSNPNLPASSAPLPYTVVGHGPAAVPPGTFTNPVVGAFFDIELRGQGDQLILYSSAEVGFTTVPEASSFAMMGALAVVVGIVRVGQRSARKP